MHRKHIVIILLSLLWAALQAAPVDPDAAAAIATKHFASGNRLKTAAQPLLVDRTDAAYLFRSGSRFTLVAADDRLPELLGYGTTDTDRVPEALRSLGTDYRRLLAALPEGRPAARATTEGPVVAPMLTFQHGQEAPYNMFCPYYVDADGHRSAQPCVAGCVATALEQVMAYYRTTYTLRDTLHGWQTDHYTIPDILPDRSIATATFADTYAPHEAEKGTECARLMYWLAVGAKMEFTPASSGTSTRYTLPALEKAFGLGYIHFADSYKYTPADWLSMIDRELAAGRPVYYAANTMRLSGHAFVVDGRDADGMYHINWGYAGDMNGWFDLAILYSGEPATDMTPAGSEQGFFCNHEALFLHPEAQDVSLPDTLQRTGEEIVCTDWQLLQAAEHKEYTAMHLTLRNTSDLRLSTPLEIFTNLPSDTALFAQADYVALTQITLDGGEERTFTVHLRFDEAGERTMSLSADDEHYQVLGTVSIAPHQHAALAFAKPEISFPDATTLNIIENYKNTSAVGRSGQIVTYELTRPTADPPQTRYHAHYSYLAPAEATRDEVSFRALEPGALYCLRVRCPWTVVAETYFVQGQGEVSGIADVYNNIVSPQPNLYDLSGRHLRSMPRHGIVISSDGQKTFKK